MYTLLLSSFCDNDTAPTTTSPLLSKPHCLLFSQSLSDFESFHRLSSFCDDVDETGSAAVNQSILGRQSGQASHIVLSCAGNFVSSGLKAKTRVDLEKRRAEKERAEKGHVPSEPHCLLFSQSLSDFESFHRLSSFCDDVDETGSAASYSFLNSSLISSQSIHIGTTVGQASHIVLSCAGNFVSSGLKAKTRVDLEKRRAEKERAEKGHVPSGYFLPLTFKVFQLAAYPPFPASDMGWGKELGQVQD
ncbi:hypothetical protein Prudu_015669 [Prunus dulcis]|uniref:Uncharacterized protein n=1 Tax=Prunus dulcis TaxID=3755 RepID=A0A4Y1RJJ3_PRUDU|nr:hypothetical protein Prudu_015669 [Prunus dulcis]